MTADFLNTIVALKINEEQDRYFTGCAYAARKAYNFGLNRYNRCINRYIDSGCNSDLPDHSAIAREFTSLKATTFSWAKEFSSTATSGALSELRERFERYFDFWAGKYPSDFFNVEAPKRPQPISKSEPISFLAARSPRDFKISGAKIKLPKVGWVDLVSEPKLKLSPKGVKLYKESGQWFALISPT